jgi:hypothetical protein
MQKSMTPVVRRFERGIALGDPGLRDWLDAHAGEVVRVPIALGRAQVGFSLHGARLATLVIDVLDAALGVGLADRAHRETGATASFVVEARWRDGVLHVIAATLAAIDAITHAELESREPLAR